MINNSNLKDKDQKKERKDERKKEQKEKEKGLGWGDNKTQRKDILQEGEKKAIFTLRKKK